MRALFTQLSFLIGLVTAFEMYGRQPSLPVAVLLGLAAACTFYIIMLLGDQAVHRYFEDTAENKASLTHLDTGYDPTDQSSGRSQDELEPVSDNPETLAA